MATAPDPDPVKQMETLLECSICMETLTQPRTLSCYHSFCKHCLENFVAALRLKAVEAEAKVPEVFQCPVCRTEFSVQRKESIGEKIPSNHFINSLLDLLTIQQQANAVKCQSCKAKAPAASRCISCERYLCGKCLEIHSNWAAFEDHVVLTLDELAKPENRAKSKGKPRCEKHNKALKFYCKSCKVVVCRYCLDVNHARLEHLWFPLADVVVEYKEALHKSCGIFEQQNNDAAGSNCKIEQAMENLKYCTLQAKGAIWKQHQDILDSFTKKLEKETTALLDQVDKKYTEINEPLAKQQADAKVFFEKTKSSLDFARNLIVSGSDEEIVALKQEIQEKAGNMRNERPKFMKPMHDGNVEYRPRAIQGVVERIKLNNLGKIGLYKYSNYTLHV